jgi:hypothetical protein
VIASLVHPDACAHLFVMFNARKRNGRFGTENAIQSMKRRHVHDVDDQPCDDITDAPGSETIKVRSSRGSFFRKTAHTLPCTMPNTDSVTDAHCEYIDCAELCHMPQHTDSIDTLLPVPVFSVTGRRVVEWDFLAKQLDRGCTICNHRLTSSNVTKEQPYGLASVMDFTCDRCGGVTPLSTNKCHKTTQKARRGAYDVNTKAALG